MDNTPPELNQAKSATQLAMQAADQRAHEARTALHEDVLTHITKSAVERISSGLRLDLSEHTCDSTATWIARAAKSVPLFMPAGGRMTAVTYGVAAALYGAGEAKWGDSADNITKDALLGGLKGVGIKGSMDLIGHKMQESGLANRFWSAPAQGVAFGVSSTAIETGLSRSTYHDAQGNYRGIGYGLENTVKAVANPESLVIGAATFTLGAAAMKGIQASPIASAFPEVVSSKVFQNATTGFSFGAFSGMADEANRQAKSGGFSPWELNKFNYGEIAKQGLFQATSDATGAAIAGKFAPHPVVPMEQVEHKNVPPEQIIRRHSDIAQIVDQPLRKSVSALWDNNIRTIRSGIYHDSEPSWSTFPSPINRGEYEPIYYKMTVGKDIRTYVDLNREAVYKPEELSANRTKRAAYIVLDEVALSPENQQIARQLGKYRSDLQIEIQVPYQEGTPAHEVEKMMHTLVSQFQPQDLKWGSQTPIQFYRSEMKRDTGIPTEQWMGDKVTSQDFKDRGLVWDPVHNRVFASQELALKYQQSPPPEPTWYHGPDVFANLARGGWRQAYNQVAVHLYTLQGQRVELNSDARKPDKNFTIEDLMRPENADHYLSDRPRFFELYGTKAYDALADRHWLTLRKDAFEAVERTWPSATLERDRAIGLGSVLLARATEGHGYFEATDPSDVFSIKAMVPEYLWRDANGRRLSTEEVVYKVNQIYYDVFQIAKSPFDHTFGRTVVDQIHSADGDMVVDQVQNQNDEARSLEALMRKGWKMRVNPRYIPLLKDILEKQAEGSIPDRFESTLDPDSRFMNYTPVYRPATAEEVNIPLSELVKNLKIVDYGFSNRDGKVLGKVSLASHDVHDHARAFWLLDKAGLFNGTAEHQGYKDLMGKMTDPVNTGIFKREGELVASVAYDWRNFFDTHPSYEPAVNLHGIRNYFVYADRHGIPLTQNQSRALAFLEERLRTDPEGQTPSSKKLRHILGGVWLETLEQKRKTETTLYKREDGTFQRLSATNPEYLAFVIDAARILEKNGPQMWYSLNMNNLKMEGYLRDVAALSPGSKVPRFTYSPQEITQPRPAEVNVPANVQDWLMQHPGFNTRRAPVRDWILGIPTQEELAEQRQRQELEQMMSDWRRRDYESQEWRNLMYRND